MHRALVSAALALACAGTLALAEGATPNPMAESPTWTELRGDVVGDVPLADGGALLTLDAPYRAHEAATVPIVLRQADPSKTITSAIVVIDENPAPVAGTFTFAKAMSPLDFEMRVRVNQYSNVRAIVEAGGENFMTGRFVKASGGCSAPASRDPASALATMGQMKVKSFGAAEDGRREAQIMIRHPNYSGLQRDQVTHLFIGAHFIDRLEVYQGDELLFTMEGGISISENPIFRFAYTDNGTETFTIRATDTEGNHFEKTLQKEPLS